MKNLKKAIAAISLLMCLMLMCSCMRMETGVIINSDGTGRVFSEITVSEKMLEQSGQTKEDFLKSVTQSDDNDKYENWNKEEVERTIPGETEDEIYIGVRYYKDGKLDELMGDLDDDDASSLSYDIKSENGNIVVTINITNNQEGTAGGEINEYISQGMMKVYFTITAPTEIVDTNGTLSEDKRTATWDILSIMTGADKETTMTVAFKENSPFLLMLIIMGGVLVAAVIAGVIIVAVSKRKYKPRRNSYEAQPVPAPVPTEQSYTTQPVPQPVEVTAQPEATAPAAAEDTASEEAEKKQSFCMNCGAKLEYESAFCMNCGEPVKK